ncbi:MAG TPA: hypothetical protein VIV40_43620 [Kofleriaceae bacterium]
MAACGGTPREASRPKPTTKPAPVESGHLKELENPPPAKLLSIDWSKVSLTSEADALALWQQIAPTGADYTERLDELPDQGDIAEQLAVALLHGGNFTCVPAATTRDCMKAPIDVPEPARDATLADPCLRRVLAMWAINQLDDHLADARDALRAIVAIPPPESELVAIALKALPESEQDGLLELYSIAFKAGHRELVNGMLGTLDDSHLLAAVQKHHMDGALDLLSAESNRAVFLAAITDESLHGSARVQAISELLAADDKVQKDTHAAIVRATRSPDCRVAAAAAQFLVRNGEKKFGPAKPRTGKLDAMMRAICVLASYESAQRADEPSFLLGYVPKKGLELVTIKYDEYSETDTDGDGDPHTEKQTVLVPRDEVTLPETEDLIRALAHCKGAVCRSEDREFRFVFKGADLLLTRLEVSERPPCNRPAITNP